MTLIDALKAQGLSDALIATTLKALAATGGNAPKSCGCGCGLMTKGGKYKPGHDAKHMSATLKAIRAVAAAPKPVAPVVETMGVETQPTVTEEVTDQAAA